MCMPEMCTRISSPLVSTYVQNEGIIFLQEEYIINNIAQKTYY